MKANKFFLALTASLGATATLAQNYTLDWSTIGGGGTSTGGIYSVSAMIGEVAAGATSGGGYTLDGGFWSGASDTSELIVNGSFENVSNSFAADAFGLMTQSAGATTIPGWTTLNAELAWVSNTNSFGAATPFGEHSLELTGYHDGQPYGGVTQTIATTPGQHYRLSLALGSNADYPGAGGQKAVSVCLGSAGATLIMTPTNTSGNQWSDLSFNFTANSTSTLVTIVGVISGGGVYLGLDNVSVTPQISAPPLPVIDVVGNGSFENVTCLFVPDSAGLKSLPAGSTDIPGWTVTDAEIVWGINGNAFGPRSPFGSLFVDLTGYHDGTPYGGVSQMLATTPGQAYRLTFSLGADEDVVAYRGPVSVGVTVGSVSNVFTLTPAGGATGNVWLTFTHDFTADSDSTLLAFAGTAAEGGGYLGLDNISAVPLAPEFRITDVERLGDDLRLSFNSVIGKDYAVQSRVDLSSGDWETLPGTTNSGTGGTVQATVTNALLAPQQFYRIQQWP